MDARPDRRPHGWIGLLVLVLVLVLAAAVALVASALIGSGAAGLTGGAPSDQPSTGAPDRLAWSIDAPAAIARTTTPGRPALGPWVLGTLLGGALGALALRWQQLTWTIGPAPTLVGRPCVARSGRGPPRGAARPI